MANTFFEHKMIHRKTWKRRDERGDQMSVIDCIAVDEILRKDVLDAKVVRGICVGSDHYAVLAKFKLRRKWEYGRSNGKEKGGKVLASGKMDRKEVREEYMKRVGERLREARTTLEEEPSVNCVFDVFKEVVLGVAEEVVGYRVQKGGRRENVWWTDEIREAVGEKRAYK